MKVKFVLLVIALCGVSDIKAGLFDSFTGAAKEAIGKVSGKIPAPIPTLPSFNFNQNLNPCERDVTREFTKDAYAFAVRLFKRVAFYNNEHFLISPLSMWMSLAALAEGADGQYQSELFAALNLPQERCVREKYYQIALSRERPGNDVQFARKRLMVLDQGLQLNESWAEYIKLSNLLETSFAPIRADPVAVGIQLKDFIGARYFPAITGNSILVDSLDYQGLWTTAFPEARIERGPFFNEAGENVGMVDYLKIKQRVKLAHLPLIDAKVLDLPVGENGRYRMWIAVGLSNKGLKNAIALLVDAIVLEAFSLLKESVIPLEVAIPRFSFNFEYEATGALDDMGVGSLFKHPEATGGISIPPAQPGNFYQRVAVTIDGAGVSPLSSNAGPLDKLGPIGAIGAIGSMATNAATGLAAAVGRDFIANRPFMFSLFDSETNTCLFAGSYSTPNAL